MANLATILYYSLDRRKIFYSVNPKRMLTATFDKILRINYF